MANYRVPILDYFIWQRPVEDKDLSSAPSGPSKGDRYIVGSSVPSGDDWTGHEDDITYYDGSAWQFITKEEGMFTYVKDEDEVYYYITSWKQANEELRKFINKAGHGFSVGDVLKHSGGTYAKAQADSSANAEAVGIVSKVFDADNFTISFSGYIDGLSGLTADTVYFLSDATAGLLTSTAPTTEGSISKPLFIAISTTAGYFFNFRGVELTDNTAYYTSFDDGDLSSGILTVTHNLGHTYCQVQVFDNNDKLIIPDEIELTGTNTLTVDLSSYGTISGTWRVIVLDVGSTVANPQIVIQDADGDTKIQVEESADEDKIRFDAGGTQEAQIDSDGLTLKSGASVNELSTDGTLAGNSDDAVPTEKAVKTYADGGLANVYVGTLTRDVSVANADVAYTGVGFTPKAVIFINAMGSVSQDISSMGADSVSVRGCKFADTARGGHLTPDTRQSIIAMVSAGPNYHTGRIKSMDADGFTITWAKTGAPTGTITVIYLAIR